MRDVRQNILNDQIQTAKAIENLVRSLITEQENILKDAYENYKQLNQQSSNNEDLEPMLEKLDIARTQIEMVQNSFSLPKPRPRRKIVRLTKRQLTYGFMLKTDTEQDLHYIDKVIIGSPAANAGLKNLDRVFSINNVSLSERGHEFAVKLVQKYDTQVYMEILVYE